MRANLLLTSVLALGVAGLAACGETETTTVPAQPAATGGTADHATSSDAARATTTESGTAELRDNDGQGVGTVSLTQAPTGLLMRVEVNGLAPGWHGIHIHETGDCGDAAFQNAGGHINHARDVPHGLLNAEGPDDGDLPNIYANENGEARAEIFTTRARIAENGPGQWLWDDDGSAIVIHANPDDHRSQPIGGAGDRVACAVVQRG
ncbi:MAG: superoxide dismutase family protein [Brevundimonas sp.]|uniref:superoxide dismutase family protein n=1 Tax=Brevundimonas sp. TaxID=1871086 RepID=UPI00391B8558